jgi:glycosyltransferase involved in cell wall biosynthesis
MSLKILILTPRIPFPLKDGGAIAMHQTIEGYVQQGCEVSLLSMNTSRHWVDENLLPEWYSKLVHFKTVFINNNINPLSAFFNLFTGKSYNVSRFINKNFETALIELIKQETFDIIQFESIYTSPYLQIAQENSDSKCFCRVHNIEHLIWQRLSENEANFLKRKYLKILTNRLKIYEIDILKKFDLLLPISRTEEKYFSDNKINASFYLPFGIDINKPILKNIEQNVQSIYHIGSMDWAPNVEGITWFLSTVWDDLQTELKDVKLFLAGKNMPKSLLKKENNQTVILGEIEDFSAFSLSKNIMIVPLLSGAGIRIKVLEAMAFGKVVIATEIAVEGIGLTHQKNVLIANSPEDFKEQLHYCFSNLEKIKSIGDHAKQFVEANYSKEKIYLEVVEQFQHLAI